MELNTDCLKTGKEIGSRLARILTINLKMCTMKKLFFAFFLLSTCINLGNAQQENDTIYGIVLKPVVEIVDHEFQRNYNRMLQKMKRIYPLAIHAKQLFVNYEKEAATLDKKRQIKKYGKTAYEQLMEDFEFIIRDMYVSDGQLLVKLIHRETGMTVFDIVKKYRGALQANYFQSVGFFFDQNMKTTFNPDAEDWLIEYIAKEIEAGKHKLQAVEIITKEQFKAKKAKEKEQRKATKQKAKAAKKKAKKNN